jgi:dTDP-4-dehydrorhamnose reductase
LDILIFGGTGQLGIELARLDWGKGVELHLPTRRQVDGADEGAVRSAVAARRWACIVNAAAYTAVDAAEREVATAWQVNALFPAVLASAAAQAGVPCLQVSTDYVFDGTKPTPYAPDDPISPTNVYGASKAGGELAVRTANPRHVVLRTAWLVSAHRANFVKTMLRLARERDVLRVVDDQSGCPTSASDLACAVRRIALRQASDACAPCGTYHFVNAGQTTWCGLARLVVGTAGRGGAAAVPVEAIATADHPTLARRPANSTLSTATLTRDFGIAPRPWQEAVDDILATLLAEPAAAAPRPA